jgi:hypothetical protein
MDFNAAEHVMDGQPEPTNAELVEQFQKIIELHEKLNRECITHFIATYNATIIIIIVVVSSANSSLGVGTLMLSFTTVD